MCFLTDSIKESLRMRDGERQALGKVVKGGSFLMQEGSPSTITKDGGSTADNLFFPALSYQKKKKEHKDKGQRLRTRPGVPGTLGWGGGGVVDSESVDAHLLPVHRRLQE